MKRSDAVADIRLVPRTCRGPHVLSTAIVVAAVAAAIAKDREIPADVPDVDEDDEDSVAAHAKALAAFIERQAEWFTEAVEAELLGLSTPTDVQMALLEAGHNRMASLVDTVARGKGCGANINDLICAAPLDAVSRTQPCPKCKRPTTFTPGFYEIDADDPDRIEGDPAPTPASAP